MTVRGGSISWKQLAMAIGIIVGLSTLQGAVIVPMVKSALEEDFVTRQEMKLILDWLQRIDRKLDGR